MIVHRRIFLSIIFSIVIIGAVAIAYAVFYNDDAVPSAPAPETSTNVETPETPPTSAPEESVPVNTNTNTNMTAGLQWMTLSTPSGMPIQVVYDNPDPSKVLPAVIYYHAAIVDEKGYDQALKAGYDVADFVEAIAAHGLIGIAPIRPSNLNESDDLLAMTIDYLKSQTNVSAANIFMIGFSKGGRYALQYAISHSQDIKAVVAIAPAIVEREGALVLAKAGALAVPLYIALGTYEPNPEIAGNVKKLITILASQDKNFSYKIDYPGDHKWFYTVRDTFWNDVMRFIDEQAH